MIWALSAVSCAGFLAIMVLSLGSERFGSGPYWPPHRPDSWQHKSFRLLFRVGLYPLVALCAILGRDEGFYMPLTGFSLFILGFGAALVFTGKLGWKQAFGTAQGLVTSGPYALSRNPVYVASWLGLIGWGLCLPHLPVLVPLALWALLYLIAPFLEEPWLERNFGAAYRSYKKATPRFLGFKR